MDPKMRIRSFAVYQTAEGWFWKWRGLGRSVGPFQTLPEVLADLQHVMGVKEETPMRELTGQEEKIVEQALRDSGQIILHDPTTSPCPTCGFQKIGRAKPIVIEED